MSRHVTAGLLLRRLRLSPPAAATAGAALAAAVLATRGPHADGDDAAEGAIIRLLPPTRNVASCRPRQVGEDETTRFQRAVSYHRSLLSTYRSKWEYSAEGTATTASHIPSRSWPSDRDLPADDDLPALLAEVKYCKRSPNFRNDEDYCDALRFRVATAFLANADNEQGQKRGMHILRDLAERGHADAMCYYGICMNDGHGGNDPNPVQAVSWFRRCVDLYDHPQAMYELGVALYTGEGVVENETEAVSWFRQAAEAGHPAASYMLGDCLLDGVGTDQDRAQALEWLVAAAELGHRGARSRVMAVLQRKPGVDYGRFTDSSRQTLSSVVSKVDETGKIVKKTTKVPIPSNFERRFTIGGGVRNPVILARRKTIVQESRET